MSSASVRSCAPHREMTLRHVLHRIHVLALSPQWQRNPVIRTRWISTSTSDKGAPSRPRPPRGGDAGDFMGQEGCPGDGALFFDVVVIAAGNRFRV